jgi:hypothetical protein
MARGARSDTTATRSPPFLSHAKQTQTQHPPPAKPPEEKQRESLISLNPRLKYSTRYTFLYGASTCPSRMAAYRAAVV